MARFNAFVSCKRLDPEELDFLLLIAVCKAVGVGLNLLDYYKVTREC